MMTPTRDAPSDDIDGDCNPSAAERSAEDNPWVPMPDFIRYLAIATLGVYAAVCVIGALLNTADNASSPLLAFSDLVYFAVLAVPLLAYDRAQHGWFHPLVFGTLYVMVRQLPRSCGMFVYGLESHAILPDSAEELTRLVAYSNFLNTLALAATYAGFHLVRNPPALNLPLRTPSRFGPAIVVAALISFGSLAVLVALSGSITQHVLNLSLNQTARVMETDVAGLGQFVLPAQWFAFFLAILLGYRPESLRRPWFWIASLVALAVVYLAAGKRSILLTPLATGAIVWMMTVRRVPVFRIVALLGVMFLLMSGLLLVRTAIASGAKDLGEVSAMLSDRLDTAVAEQVEEMKVRGGEYTTQYPIFKLVPSESPLLWGETYLVLLARPIPRFLWPEKPRGTDFRAGATFFNAAWGIPPGPVAEAYWNFHVPGVIGVYFLFGAFYRWLHNTFLRQGHHGLVVYVYAFTLLVLTPTENTITGWMMNLMPTVLFGLATGALRRGSAESA